MMYNSEPENHVFSESYQARKQKLIRRYSKRIISRRTWILTAAALMLLTATAIAAVTHASFFHDAFGKKRENVSAREETAVIDKGYEAEVTYQYPSHEYVEPDQEKAEELIGEAIAVPKEGEEGAVYTVRGHTFTLLSAVRDRNVLVLEYTIECPDGVTALTWNEHSDDAHGAVSSPDALFWYGTEGSISRKIWVDYEKSSNSKLYCVEYDLLGTIDPEEQEQYLEKVEEWTVTEGDTLTIYSPYGAGDNVRRWFLTYDPEPEMPLKEALEQELITSDDQLTKSFWEFSVPEQLDVTVFKSEEGGYLEISPIGVRVDSLKGLGLDAALAMDGLGYSTITIDYKDGSEYVVFDHGVKVDNTSDMCALYTWWYIAFNRLVDVEEIESVEINGTIYRLADDQTTMTENPEMEKKVKSDPQASESRSSETDWVRKENHYMVGEEVSVSNEKDQTEMGCIITDITIYEDGYIEAGLQEWVTDNRPEIVDYQDQACIDATFLTRNINEEDPNDESLLENLQIILSDDSQNDIPYTSPFRLSPETGNIRPDGYQCYHVSFLCPKEYVNSPFLCLKLEGKDKSSEVYFDINMTDPGFDPKQYDIRFLDR